MGNQLVSLSADDVAGGFKTISSYTAEHAAEHLSNAKKAASKIDFKNGWAPFAESAKTEDSRMMVARAPAGAALFIVSYLCWALFCAILCSSKYGPQAAEMVKIKATQAGEAIQRGMVPLKQKLRPMIADAKARIDAAIAERKANIPRSDDSAQEMVGDAEAPTVDDEDEL